jgi:glycosyltransferase involved in cell wall biosynthesis
MQESIMTLAVYTVPVSGSSIITRAMSNGTPIIASRIGAASEYLKDVGVKISPNDPRALADAILALKNNPDLARNLGEKARRQAWQISWNVIARRTLNVYRTVLEDDVE